MIKFFNHMVGKPPIVLFVSDRLFFGSNEVNQNKYMKLSPAER